jgi:thiol-disulfide isomerase/thioredoxin
MKSLLLIPFLIVLTAGSRAQTCMVSGSIKDSSIKTLELVLLYADGDYSTHTHSLKLASDGHFKQQVQLSHPVFALLKTGTAQYRLLLSPDRDLQIRINNRSILYDGKAAPENRLVHQSPLDSTPFFMKGIWNADIKQYDEAIPYSKVTVNGWNDTIMNRVEKEIADRKIRIQKAALPPDIKKILISETYYVYQCYLNDFTRYNLRRSKNPHADSLLTRVMQWKPIPDSVSLVSGYYANMIIDRHGQYGIYTVGKNRTGGRTAMQDRLGNYLGMPYNAIDSLVKLYGETAVTCLLYARQQLPRNIQDKILFNKIIEEVNSGSLSAGMFLLRHMQQNYPASNYLRQAEAIMQRLDNTFRNNAGNARIIYKNAEGIRSLRDLVKPYAGKIVYLDIWGTWCGPCKKEMPYTHELKQKYAGKDIVFVYLDMDPANKEPVWKEYVQLAGLEGEHYRMDETAIKAIWDDLQATGEQRLHTYPAYIIIDRQGNIVNSNAERPGSRQKLYAQLDKLL